MTRVLALLVTLFPAVTLTLAEDQSRPNKLEESNSFNVELLILKQDLSGDRSAPEAPGAAVARLEKIRRSKTRRQRRGRPLQTWGAFEIGNGATIVECDSMRG
jgi:hypothetical protein